MRAIIAALRSIQSVQSLERGEVGKHHKRHSNPALWVASAFIRRDGYAPTFTGKSRCSFLRRWACRLMWRNKNVAKLFASNSLRAAMMTIKRFFFWCVFFRRVCRFKVLGKERSICWLFSPSLYLVRHCKDSASWLVIQLNGGLTPSELRSINTQPEASSVHDNYVGNTRARCCLVCSYST